MTRPATCRCGQLFATCTDEPVRISVSHFPAPGFSVWYERRHPWVAIIGDAVEHHV